MRIFRFIDVVIRSIPMCWKLSKTGHYYRVVITSKNQNFIDEFRKGVYTLEAKLKKKYDARKII